MENHGVTSLYMKVVSPTVKFQTEEWNKQHHYRHSNYRGLSPTIRRRLAVSPSRSTYSAPGRVENQLAIRQGSPEGGEEQLQNGHYSFYPTIAFKTASLPAMPLSRKYTPSIAATIKSVPISISRRSAISLPDRLAQENPRPLFTSQRQRWEAEGKARSQTRQLRRTSENIAHRRDKHYYMAGTKIPVQGRYQVDTNDLLRLKLLAHRKQLAEYQKMKQSGTYMLDTPESPGGQTSSPTPEDQGRRGESGALSLTSELESPHGREGAWAEPASEVSSVDEFDSISMRGHQVEPRDNKRANENAEEQNQEANGDNEREAKEFESKSDDKEGSEVKGDEIDSENNNTEVSEEKEIEPSENNVEVSEEKENEATDKIDGEKAVETLEENENHKTGNKDKIDGSESENDKNTNKVSGKKASLSVKPAKKGRIRFKDEVKANRGGKGPMKDEKNNEGDSNGGDKEDEKHENKYLNEWLGIKKKEVDPRYRPGKPPPNRIFISADPVKAKKGAGKFSEIFLTEIATVKPDYGDSGDELPANAQYGIINSKQHAAFKSMFEEVDKDKNGSVTLEELKLRMMPSISRGDIKHFVQVFDLNKDQTIDGREFTAICSLNDRLAGSRTETADGSIALNLEKLAQHIVIFKEMFKIMDEDDDNRLDANEVLIMVSAAMATEMGSDLELARAVLDGARDEFGYIDFVGFLSYIPFFAKLLKAIMANPLSIAQIEQARHRVKQKDLTFKLRKSPKKKEPKSWEAF